LLNFVNVNVAGGVKKLGYAAEISCRKLAANAVILNVVKLLEYGDNIERRIDGRSLLADQSWKGLSDTGRAGL
jgi:hypothetical protein